MNLKNILIITSIFLVLLTGSYLFQTTYAKYKKSISGNIDMSIASWNILVNNETILNKSVLNNSITPIFSGNEYLEEGVIAPGASGYYDIIINANNTDVSFTYKILSSVSATSTVVDLITTGYIINPLDNSNIINYTSEGITGEITHGTAETVIRVFIKWDDSSSASMNNQSDTLAATNTEATALMTADITFTQINN